MKVLVWTPQFWPDIGGIEVFLSKTLPSLQEIGHEFKVVASDPESNREDVTEFNGILVHRFPFWRALAKRDLAQIARIRREISALKLTYQPDLVHIHYPGHIAYFHLHTAKTHPAPTLLTIHTPFPGARSETDTLFSQALRSADWVTAVSQATLADTIESVPDLRHRSSVIHNGLPVPQVLPTPLPFDPPRILYVGRLADEKGGDIALSAFAALRNRFPHIHLIVAGDGPARDELKRQAGKLNLSEVVEFTGWIQPEKIPDVINRSTLVVIPSRYREPFGLIAVEAAQMGRPVVAAKTGGLPEIVTDRATGLLFPGENHNACADAIASLLDDPARARRMGEAGRSRVTTLFTLEKCVAAYDELYQKLIQQSRVTIAPLQN